MATDHHAFLIESSNPFSWQWPYSNSDSVYFTNVDSLGIDGVRNLINKAHLKPQGNSRDQFLVIKTHFITIEAQQALLKILEEPPVGTKFYFIIPKGYELLPTVLSRFHKESSDLKPEENSIFLSFMLQTTSEQLGEVETRLKQKDNVWLYEMKQGLLNHLQFNRDQFSTEKLRSLNFVLTNLLQRGSANKMLLEEMVLTLKDYKPR